MLKHVDIRVAGKVQGVFFRVAVKERALELGLVGFVRNEDDGSVYIEAEGEASKLDQLITWCSKGPRSAQVTKVMAKPAVVQHFSDFSITG